MALSITHSYVSAVPDAGDASLVQPSDWNDVHDISGLAAGIEDFLATPSSANLKTAVTDETGSGALVFANTPTLVTPVLGVATATSINKVSITAPATSATLTLADGSTLVTSGANSITLTSSGATNVTLPTTGTLATLAGSEAFTNKTLTAAKIASGGFLADANGNELIIFTTTASAVNELTYANGSTGVNPKWTSSGETNVGMDFQAKGTGTFRFLGTADQAAQLRLYEDTDAGSNYTGFRVGTQAGDITYTLPTAVAAGAGYVLTDAAADGVLSWAAAGGVPTAITVANEATDTTCFPLFVTAATGDLGPKTVAGFTLNSNTGQLGATIVRVGDGSAGTPSIGFANDVDTGFNLFAAGYVMLTAGGTNRFILGQDGLGLRSDSLFYWSSGAAEDVGDVRLSRIASAILGLRGAGSTSAAAVNFYTHGASPPSAPSASMALLYSDTSGGKIRLMALFPSGAAQQIAIEP
jgi:hypothetical protein